MTRISAPYRNSFIQSMEDAQQHIYNRLSKIADIFSDIKAEYAVIGGNAIIAWMRARKMDSRTTRDVDLMLRKEDLPEIRDALEKQGYEFIKTGGMSLFFDTTEGVDRNVENCIHLVFCGQKIKNSTIPELEYHEFGGMKVATIENLVKMKVAAMRPKDFEHLQNLIDAGYTTKTKVLGIAEGMCHTDLQKNLLSVLEERSQVSKVLPPPKGKTRDLER